MGRVTVDGITAARRDHIRRAFQELKAMPRYTHAVLLVLGPDALTVHIETELPQAALIEVLGQSLAFVRGQRGRNASNDSKLIIAP